MSPEPPLPRQHGTTLPDGDPQENKSCTEDAYEQLKNDNEPNRDESTTETKVAHLDSIPEALRPLIEIYKLHSQEKIQEDSYDVYEDAWKSIHESWSRNVLEENRRHGQLPVRSHQAILHHNFTVMRIDDLEKEVERLKARVYDLGDDHEFNTVKKRFPVHLHELCQSSPNNFPLNSDSVILPTSKLPALEDETKEPGVGPTTPDTLSGNSNGGLQISPERLRIRSRPLMLHLERLSGNSILSLAAVNRLGTKRVHSAVVFLRPFKFFFRHETAIRRSLEKLKDQAQLESHKNSESNPNGLQNDHEHDETNQQQFDVKDLREDLKLLVNFLDVYLKPTFNLREKIENGLAVDIEYADLAHLFERGEIVVTRSNQAYARMVINVAGGREPLTSRFGPEDGKKPVSIAGFAIDCISFGTDGTSYVPKLEQFKIRKYKGRLPISSLPIYPLKFDSNSEELRATFLKAGTEFLEVTRGSFCHKMAKGKTYDEPSHNLDAQVIIDMTLAMNAKPEWRLSSTVNMDDLTSRDQRETKELSWCKHPHSYMGCCGGDVIFNDLECEDLDAQDFNAKMGRVLGPLSREELTEDYLMLMRPYVHAFVLRSRQWVTIHSANLHDVVFENNFADLVLPGDHKIAVQALVRTHEDGRTPQSSSPSNFGIGAALDLVKGKGSGLVILLHGPPGVGKTSTAECVADDTRRPLYPITCGDIGETAIDVERNLQYNFQLAHKWGCVLLLDEADIFLAKRTRTDLRHNAVTSVFIRSLEYYAGILFLTTNRVGAIDPAFRSRIQMALFYPKLDLNVTQQLYEKFIKRAKAEQDRKNSHAFKIKEREILKFGEKHFRSLEKEGYETWNGRQIRNAFQTAIALTEHQCTMRSPSDPRPFLGKEQFKTVANRFKQFDTYLHRTLGGTDTDMAKREGMRNDNFMTVAEATRMAAPIIALPTTPQPIYESHLRQRVGQVRGYESDEDTESETSSDEGQDDRPTKASAGKPAAAASIEEQTTAASGNTGDMNEFKEFMKWKKQLRRK